MASSSCTIADLTCCAICLESFTRPKVLPCQHTYCYSCLMSLVRDDKVITCPQCRDVHAVPKDGIAAFKDNFIVNNLLGMSSDTLTLCSDCKLKPAVSPCEHCNAKICVTCLVEHIKLSMEIKTSLSEVKSDILSPKTVEKRKKLEAAKSELCKELNDLKAIQEQKLRELASLLQSASSLKHSTRAYDDILQSTGMDATGASHFANLALKLEKCTTVNSMKVLRADLSDLKKVVHRLSQSNDDNFPIVSKPETVDSPVLRLVEFAQVVMDSYDNQGTDVTIENIIERMSELGAGKSNISKNVSATHRVSEICPDKESDILTGPTGESFSKSAADSAGAQCSKSGEGHKPSSSRVKSSVSEKTLHSVSGHTPTQLYRHYKFPKSVDYHSKGKGWIPIIGQGKNVEKPNRLYQPCALAYHEATDEIFVADRGNNRVMVYWSDGSHACVFCNVTRGPNDIAISTDGAFVFVATGFSLKKFDMTGECAKTIRECSLGEFVSCCAVDCHEEFTVAVDEDLQCVFVYDQNEREIRRFGRKYLVLPGCIGMSTDGTMFITDDRREIKVFKWNGQYLNTFLSSEEVAFEEVAVDGDGFVCVTKEKEGIIEVYDPLKKLVATIGGPGKRPGRLDTPCGVCFMPDGRLIVVEHGNNRLQIF